MYSVEPEFEIPIFEDSQSGRDSAAIAILSEEDFVRAQEIVHGLESYFGYEDWLNCRDGFRIGLAMAGVDVKTVSLALSPFLAWRRMTGAQANEKALDSFALFLVNLRASPAASAFALVNRQDFDAYAPKVEAFALHDDHERWTSHREAARRELAAPGARIQDLTILPHDFVEWSKCLGRDTSEAALDVYANLLLEFLIEEVGPGHPEPA